MQAGPSQKTVIALKLPKTELPLVYRSVAPQHLEGMMLKTKLHKPPGDKLPEAGLTKHPKGKPPEVLLIGTKRMCEPPKSKIPKA